MTKVFLMTTAALLSIAASPVVARDARPATATTDSTRATDAVRIKSSAQRYCVVDSVTGSRIPLKICQTRAQWLEEGFDPLAKR